MASGSLVSSDSIFGDDNSLVAGDEGNTVGAGVPVQVVGGVRVRVNL